jgi:hypothetical protein
MDDAAAGKAWRWFLPALLGSTAALKLFLAWRFPAFLTGDDVEIVETAAKYAIGLDYHPWAIRSLFHPLVLAFPFVKRKTGSIVYRKENGVDRRKTGSIVYRCIKANGWPSSPLTRVDSSLPKNPAIRATEIPLSARAR